MAGFTTVTNSLYGTTATDKGTKIVKPEETMDKNSFLRILTAELSNQDPTNTKDSTEYVAQMAQFAGLEQMSNLNSTMSFTGASSLLGKYVNLNSADEEGNLYSGLVKGISKDAQGIKVSVQIDDMGTTKDFLYSDVINVYDK